MKELVKEGKWMVPVEERPDNWREILDDPVSGMRTCVEAAMPEQALVPLPVTQVVTESDTPSSTAIVEVADARGSHPQESLIGFVESRRSLALSMADELSTALDKAKKNRWNSGTIQKALKREQGNVAFFDKVLTALRAGFVVMPPVSCDVLAVRVSESADLPRGCYSDSRWRPEPRPMQADCLPLGEGRYVSVRVKYYFEHRTFQDEKNKEVNRTTAVPYAFRDMVFPVILAKPEVMDAAEHAMAMKCFDEVAVSPSTRQRSRDPILIGRIGRPRQAVGLNPVHFMIAWVVRPEELLP